MLLDGFGFSGYRSFGDRIARIGPLKKINFIVGQNNCGKSNIINYLTRHYANYIGPRAPHEPAQFDTELDHHKPSSAATPPEIKAPQNYVPVKVGDLPDLLEKASKSQSVPTYGYSAWQFKKQYGMLLDILKTDEFDCDGGLMWILMPLADNATAKVKYGDENSQDAWKKTLALFNVQSSRFWHAKLQLLSHIGQAARPPKVPPIKVIPAIRKVGSAEDTEFDYSGKGIIEKLATFQNPAIQDEAQRKSFEKINRFLQEVLENDTAQLEIPFERNMITVHMDGKRLPLESLGTGVHEVVIIAAAATMLEGTVVCIEEPEIHLHPTLQRKLIRHLDDHTDNQYLITTHSAHLLDAVDAEVFHVTLENGASVVRSASTTQERSDICHNLGYKASDILQANCVIWVEGPSDRIYLNHWIRGHDTSLEEGIHYSIMFYGGRLMSHLTGLDQDELDEEADDLIRLRSLNRFSAIVFDSDKDAEDAAVTATKTRLKEEFSKDGLAWQTEGREIENYLNADSVEKVVLEVHPSAGSLIAKGQWDNILRCETKEGQEKPVSPHKVKVARAYTEEYSCDFGVLDLGERVAELCDFIRQANGKDIIAPPGRCPTCGCESPVSEKEPELKR